MKRSFIVVSLDETTKIATVSLPRMRTIEAVEMNAFGLELGSVVTRELLKVRPPLVALDLFNLGWAAENFVSEGLGTFDPMVSLFNGRWVAFGESAIIIGFEHSMPDTFQACARICQDREQALAALREVE